MARGQQKYWQQLRKVPKEPTGKPVRIDRCIWWDNGAFQLYRYAHGKSKYVDSFATIDLAIRARDGAADDRSTAAPESRQLLNEYFDAFFLPVIEPTKKPSTIRAMNARYNTYVRESLGARRLRDVTAADIAWFQAKVERREVSGQTKRETLSLVRAIFTHAVDTNVLPTSPAGKIKLPARRPGTVSVPPYDVARSVVDAIVHPVAVMAARTMFFTGIRVGECLALLWEDVDLTARTLKISKSVDHCTGTVIAPKSKKAYRTVPIPRELGAAFLDYREAQWSGEADRRDPWLFPSAHAAGRLRPALSYEDLTKLHWNPARQRVTDARVTLHMLRHLYASRLIATGTSLTAVAKLLGHYSSGFTLAQYGHCLETADELATPSQISALRQSIDGGRLVRSRAERRLDPNEAVRVPECLRNHREGPHLKDERGGRARPHELRSWLGRRMH